MNLAIIIGNVGKEPEIGTYGSNGGVMAKFSVATTKRIKGEDSTTWHNMVAFGKTAEFVQNYVHKGDKFAFQGEISNRTVDTENGKRTYSSIIIDNVEFVQGKQKSQQQEPSQQQQTELQQTGGPITDDDLPF